MRARKRFGQHFLEPAWVTKVVKAVEAKPDESILEIGPGRAALTRPLAEQCGRMLAVEVDRDLAAELEATKPAHLTVIVGDVLEVDLAAALSEWLGVSLGPGSDVRIVGNLPYNISSPILFALLDLAAKTGGVRDAILMLQKEVADRLVAKVGTGDYGVLTVLTRVNADVTRILSLPPGAFRPPTVDIPDMAGFVRMVRTMFTQRRKTLSNALKPFGLERSVAPADALAAAGVDPRRRPETLEMAEMAALFRAFDGPQIKHRLDTD